MITTVGPCQSDDSPSDKKSDASRIELGKAELGVWMDQTNSNPASRQLGPTSALFSMPDLGQVSSRVALQITLIIKLLQTVS